uniref:Ubiquitin-like protease family profile domain-containing protein n=1 Tax=Ciona savignyi TaxID=51511 RepID=H2YV88_CIOSA
MKMDEIVLSYHDSLLRKSDLSLLEAGNWLNDKLIGFMFEYYQNEIFAENAEKVSFLDPDFVQLIKLLPDTDIEGLISPLNLGTKRLIFLPINNNPDPEAGGSHWSLLVLDQDLNIFEHYDSYGDTNYLVAVEVASKFSSILKSQVKKVPTPQQCNGSDCGVYVIKIALLIGQSKLRSSPWKPDQLTYDIISRERENMKELILSKAGSS